MIIQDMMVINKDYIFGKKQNKKWKNTEQIVVL